MQCSALGVARSLVAVAALGLPAACSADSSSSSDDEGFPAECTSGTEGPCSCLGGLQGRRTCLNGVFGSCQCAPPEPPPVPPPPDGGTVIPAAPCFTPCGGRLQGRWRFESTCSTDVAFVCATRSSVLAANATGELVFSESVLNGSFAGSARISSDLVSCSALNGTPRTTDDCRRIASTLDEQSSLSSTTCTWSNPTCSCSYTSSWDATFAQTPYSRPSDTALRIGAESEFGEYDYCVEGDRLALRPVTDRAQVTDVTYFLQRVICTPDAADCGAGVARTCNSTGTAYASETPCAAGTEACVGGACRPVVCTPDTRSCAGPRIELCDATGTSTSVEQACAEGEYCDDASAGAVVCRPKVCQPDQGACDGQTSTRCNALGSGFTGDRADCLASSLACSPGAGCLVPSSFEISSTYQPFTAGPYENEVGNVITITSTVRLIELQSYLPLPTRQSVAFFIYESPGATGDFSKILAVTVAAEAGTGFVSTGPINVELLAGNAYVLSARPEGSFGTSWGYGHTLSFGTVVDSFSIDGPMDTFTTSMARDSTLYHQRLVIGEPPVP